MTPAQLDEARRWTALRGWRWMPGMADTDGYRVLAPVDSGEVMIASDTSAVPWWANMSGAIPDLTDPATAGCLLALAREITGRPMLHAEWAPTESRWKACWHRASIPHYGGIYTKTETLALLAACEAHERAQVTP